MRAEHDDHRWERQPAAEALLTATLERTARQVEAFAVFADRLLATAGVRVRDIVDGLLVSADEAPEFEAAGWREAAQGVWRHDDGLFPAVLPGAARGLWLRVESIDDFIRANPECGVIEGQQLAGLRCAIAFRGGDTAVGVIERNGDPGFVVQPDAPARMRDARVHLNAFRARRREFDTVEAGLDHTETLIDSAVAALGPDRSCDLWLKAEREYWMRRCHAGQVQKARQDAVGIGWSNIDHHTYDSSRRHFRRTIRLFEKLGYERREMLYAGELAGWGSQVLWHPVIRSTIFADVDLSPDELTIDFAQVELPVLDKHRRAGLLSELLGESILEAGLNHVAGLFDQRALRAQMQERGIAMMTPFSDFDHLYQELTTGDWAAVDPARVDLLEARGHIGPEEAERLRLNGSIVTHLENIERNDGFKGFNRDGIDAVLRKLDPRAYLNATV